MLSEFKLSPPTTEDNSLTERTSPGFEYFTSDHTPLDTESQYLDTAGNPTSEISSSARYNHDLAVTAGVSITRVEGRDTCFETRVPVSDSKANSLVTSPDARERVASPLPDVTCLHCSLTTPCVMKDMIRHARLCEFNSVVSTAKLRFLCLFCSYVATARIAIKNHLSSHLGWKPYECEQCTAKFTQKVVLQRHKLTHTGEKPFGCHLCEYRASRKYYITAHLNSYHGND